MYQEYTIWSEICDLQCLASKKGDNRPKRKIITSRFKSNLGIASISVTMDSVQEVRNESKVGIKNFNPHTPDRFTPQTLVAQKIADRR